MNTKRDYKFANLRHAYEAYDKAMQDQRSMLAMLERVTNEYRLLGNVAGLGDENPTVSEARALIAHAKGE